MPGLILRGLFKRIPGFLHGFAAIRPAVPPENTAKVIPSAIPFKNLFGNDYGKFFVFIWEFL